MEEIARSATLTYGPSTDEGTQCHYVSDSGFVCGFLGLPDRENKKNISRPPRGKYLTVWEFSPAHGCNLYHLKGVKDRTVIEMHKGNFAGDVSLGFCSDSEGCFLAAASFAKFLKGSIHNGSDGKPVKPPRDQSGGTFSGITLGEFEKDMRDADGNQVSFYLTIQ